MKLTIEIETITPEIAQVWLEKNTNNRAIRQMVVDRYADEMRSGAWKLNAETIKFSRDGTLLDGQHRLWAVVESKVTIQSFVARGISADALQTIDSGIARRLSDKLTFSGVKNPKATAQLVNCLSIYTGGRGQLGLTANRARDLITKFSGGIEWAAQHVVIGGRSLFLTPFWAALAFAHKASPGIVESFATRTVAGIALAEHSPEYAIRSFLEHNRKATQIFGATLNAVFAAIQGRDLLKVNSNNASAFAYFAKANGLAT